MLKNTHFRVNKIWKLQKIFNKRKYAIFLSPILHELLFIPSIIGPKIEISFEVADFVFFNVLIKESEKYQITFNKTDAQAHCAQWKIS